jgi:hypothetical protein
MHAPKYLRTAAPLNTNKDIAAEQTISCYDGMVSALRQQQQGCDETAYGKGELTRLGKLH